jgi:hypothetical protein
MGTARGEGEQGLGSGPPTEVQELPPSVELCGTESSAHAENAQLDESTSDVQPPISEPEFHRPDDPDVIARRRLLREHFDIDDEDDMEKYFEWRHGIAKEKWTALSDLRESLQGVVIQDGGIDSIGDSITQKRRDAREAAVAIRDAARDIQENLGILRSNVREFKDAIGSDYVSGSLMGQIFDMPGLRPESMELPEPIDAIYAPVLDYHTEWDYALAALASLPVQPSSTTRQTNNPALQKCLTICRAWMEDYTEWGWTPGGLDNTKIREAGKLRDFPGAQVSFVIDLLVDAGANFNLTELFSHWKRTKSSSLVSLKERRSRARKKNLKI